MGIIYGLAVILIFEGIIIQCEGSPEGNTPTSNQLVKPFKKTVLIRPDKFRGNTTEYIYKGELVREFGSLAELLSFFETNGLGVEKIRLIYDDTFDSLGNDEISAAIHRDIIRKYADNFRELRIEAMYSGRGRRVWEEIDGGLNITFPSVETFQYEDRYWRKFNLSEIFPNLKSVELRGRIDDSDCLASVKKLKALALHITSIKEPKLISIFENNPEIENLTLSKMETPEMMKSIADILTKLKFLRFEYPHRDFLFGSESRIFPLVKKLSFHLNTMADIVGDPSFSMPNLRKLILCVGNFIDGLDEEAFNRIHIIGHSEKLEIVEFHIYHNAKPRSVQTVRDIFIKRGWAEYYHIQNFLENIVLKFRREL